MVNWLFWVLGQPHPNWAAHAGQVGCFWRCRPTQRCQGLGMNFLFQHAWLDRRNFMCIELFLFSTCCQAEEPDVQAWHPCFGIHVNHMVSKFKHMGGTKWKPANLQVIEDSQHVEESQPFEEVFQETQVWPLFDLKSFVIAKFFLCNEWHNKWHCKRNNLNEAEWAPPWALTSNIGDGTRLWLNLDHFFEKYMIKYACSIACT